MTLINKIKSKYVLAMIFHYLPKKKIFYISFKSKYLLKKLNLKNMYKKYFKILRDINNYIYNPNCFYFVYTNLYFEELFVDITNILIEKMKNNKVKYDIPFTHIIFKKILNLENQNLINYIITIDNNDILFIIKNNQYFNISMIQEKVIFKLFDYYPHLKYFDRLKTLNIETDLELIDFSHFENLKSLKIKGNTEILLPYKLSNQLNLFWSYGNSIKIINIPNKNNYTIFHNVNSLKLNKEIISNELIIKINNEINEKWDLLWENIILLKNTFSEFIIGERESFPQFIIEVKSNSSIFYNISDGFNFSFTMNEIFKIDLEKITNLDIFLSTKPEIIDLSIFKSLKYLHIQGENYETCINIPYKICNSLKEFWCYYADINIIDIPKEREIIILKGINYFDFVHNSVHFKCSDYLKILYSFHEKKIHKKYIEVYLTREKELEFPKNYKRVNNKFTIFINKFIINIQNIIGLCDQKPIETIKRYGSQEISAFYRTSNFY